jgi:hypothetical protein
MVAVKASVKHLLINCSGAAYLPKNYWIMKWHPMWALAMGGWYRFDAALFQSFQPGDSTEKI